MADRHPTDVDDQLHLVLDNMPGDAEPVGELYLKGFNRPVPAYNVLAIRPKTASAVPRGDA